MTSANPRRPCADALWSEARLCLAEAAWRQAEGLLWRLLQLAPEAPVSVWDCLGYALLMQGDFSGCERVLRPWARAPERSFWINHKLGDALRGQHRLLEAAQAYRCSLADGSTSDLTYRNLLQVLDGLGAGAATAELEGWAGQPDLPTVAWQGALEAAVLVPGLDLATWLWQRGHHDDRVRRRLLEEHCYELNPDGCWAILQQIADPSPWEMRLMASLHSLGFVRPGAGAAGPVAGARSLQSAAPPGAR